MTAPTLPDKKPPLRIALLIDADNVHPSFADEMFAVLGDLGVITLRRAYGNFGKPEVQKWHAAMRQHAVAPVHQHDLVAGKNATDIRLAIDAIELAVEGQVDVLAIASSDSDFSPLAIRLRERGMPVIGFAQRGKTAADLAAAFDTFHLLERSSAERNSAESSDAKPATRTRQTRAKPLTGSGRSIADAPTRVAAAMVEPPAALPPLVQPTAEREADAAEPSSTAAPKRRSRAAPRSRRAAVADDAEVASIETRPVPKTPTPPVARPVPVWPADIAAILAAVPELRAGGMPLNSASEALRRAGILQGRNASPSRLFKKYPLYFQLHPVGKPETVHFIGQPGD